MHLQNWKNLTPSPLIGVDEVGRGALAGSVFAVALVLKTAEHFPDSKSISPEQREELAKKIMQQSVWALAAASAREIDQLNILQATFLAMDRAVRKLPFSSGHILIDGPYTNPLISRRFKQTSFVKGDQYVSPIGAASILAKVKRDQWMEDMSKKWPHFHWESNKGYGSPKHIEALKRFGLSPIHRKTFRVKGVALSEQTL